MTREIIVDLFAGGGGASLGIKNATGRAPDVAINHDPSAIAMHKRNHPETEHYTEDVWRANPLKVTKGRPVGLLWLSPDCKHFSRAKGAKPVEKKIRSLAWVGIKWAHQTKARIIVLENVREFEDWGPLVPRWTCSACDWKGTEGQAKLYRKKPACPMCEDKKIVREKSQDGADCMVPDPERKGLTFRRFVGNLRGLGYKVEWRVLNAADFGAPTNRKRLFLIARNDGEKIVWPEPTHGDPKKIGTDLFNLHLKPWRTAAECIDWSLPCPSIFERKRPLAEATMRRIALGIKRYVLENPNPFIVGVGGPEYSGKPTTIEKPMGTLTTENHRAVVTPFMAKIGHTHTTGRGKYSTSVNQPLGTIVSKAEDLLVSPTLIQIGYGEREGQRPRALDLNKPLGTVVGKNHHGLASVYLAKHFTGATGQPVDDPLATVTAKDHHAKVTALLGRYYGQSVGQGVDQPLPTESKNPHSYLVAGNLIHMNFGAKQDSGLDEPMRTIMAGANHAALVYSFMVKYFGTAIGQSLDEPLHTATGKPRFGLIIVNIKGEPHVIVDIGMRMLIPRELALGNGFPREYVLTGSVANQVAKIGNSVPPPFSEFIILANYVAREIKAEAVA